MTRPGVYVDERRDVVVAARPYFSADELDVVRQDKALRIQCSWRCYQARCRATAQHQKREAFQAQMAELEERKAQQDLEERQRQAIRRENPQTKEDFTLLHNELERWRLTETRKLQEDYAHDADTKAELRAELLFKETEMLQTVGRLKQQALTESRHKRIRRVLDEMAAPKQWEMSDGEVASIHTPFTTRAGELRDLYVALVAEPGTSSVAERLDTLLHVKYTVKEFDCALTREIVELVDRETDLLNRGRKQQSMANLRRRVGTLFLQWIQTPEFNPESARFQKTLQPLSRRPEVKPILKARDKRRGMSETWTAVQSQQSKVSLTMNGGLASMSSVSTVPTRPKGGEASPTVPAPS